MQASTKRRPRKRTVRNFLGEDLAIRSGASSSRYDGHVDCVAQSFYDITRSANIQQHVPLVVGEFFLLPGGSVPRRAYSTETGNC
jgi:hypothetical protein